MLINPAEKIPVSDEKTRSLCLELIHFLSNDKVVDLEATHKAHNNLDSYLREAIANDPSCFTANELEFLIAFLNKLTDKLELKKREVAMSIIKKQRSSKALDKYKDNT